MNPSDAEKLLRKVLDEHGLTDVKTEMNARLTRVFGRYYKNVFEKKVELSVKLVKLNDEKVVYRVILHEVAHALTDGHGHDRVWQEKCLAIGGDGKRCYSSADTNVIERRRSVRTYRLECEKCNYTGGRYHRKMNGYRHRGCGGNLISVEI